MLVRLPPPHYCPERPYPYHHQLALRVDMPSKEEQRESEQKHEDRLWETYLNLAVEEDKHLPDNWEANTGGILTFVSTTVII